MNSKSLSFLLNNPSQIKKDHIDALEHLIEEFPYFQSARSILLKGLKDQGSFLYNKELKTTAAYTTDRRVLFEFITSSDFINVSPDERDNQSSVQQSAKELLVKDTISVSMDEAVAMNIDEAEEVLNPALFETKAMESNTVQEETVADTGSSAETRLQPTDTPKEELHPDAPLEFTKKETHSFTEWLKLTNLHPIDRENEEDSDAESVADKKENKTPDEKNTRLVQQQKFEIIDQFIANNPKIKPADKSQPTRNIAKEHNQAPDELMTETLARVYLSQKNYKKAIQAYKILILKNPEKSGFFADQIRAIKKLQENK
ncbi:hypothetical protein ACJRPK_04720 [Aquimarina sp. 2-A2]|uniref:hypothetical protein n=1 Tax=Aquimarina sp. 2-A2 TaxID=3382644 RepID=UPI00387F1D0D